MIGQPDSYSDILKRVFLTTVVSGIICTYVLADSIPSLHGFIVSVPQLANFGIIKDIRLLYVCIPLAIALVSRIVILHDRISDLFRIRHRFDTKSILVRLAIKSGIKSSSNLTENISKRRSELMDNVFYPYASFVQPIIGIQLVRSAADSWGWFWVLVESVFLFTLTSGILAILGNWRHFTFCAVVMFVEVILLLFVWRSLASRAALQVTAILDDKKRRLLIRDYFKRL